MITFKAFQAVNSPDFKGSAHPEDAKIWPKTEFAGYFLKHEAYYWWDSVYAMVGTTEVSWDRYKELLEKNFPHYMQDQMGINFLELKPGNGIVEEYEAKFIEIARLVPAYVSTQRQKGKEVLTWVKGMD